MIDWMNPSNDVCEAKRIGYNEGRAECEEELATLTRRVEELEGVLRWYADKHNYHTYGENICDKDLLIELDEGERARAALAAKEVK